MVPKKAGALDLQWLDRLRIHIMLSVFIIKRVKVIGIKLYQILLLLLQIELNFVFVERVLHNFANRLNGYKIVRLVLVERVKVARVKRARDALWLSLSTRVNLLVESARRLCRRFAKLKIHINHFFLLQLDDATRRLGPRLLSELFAQTLLFLFAELGQLLLEALGGLRLLQIDGQSAL
ncbi:hypothetical protein BpHYR1_020104, partial [Brachionus plicatilis]